MNIKNRFFIVFLPLIILVILVFFTKSIQSKIFQSSENHIYKPGTNIEKRIVVPKDFQRISVESGSFEEYLRNLPLKPDGSVVRLYDGSIKQGKWVYCAVIDLPIGKKDLHQCADGVIHLRADYFYKKKDYNSIHFNFTNGFKANYAKWIQGYRISVKGNNCSWVKSTNPANDDKIFWNYLEMVFSYAGTASLSKEMLKTDVNNMKIGDVFILGGHPGHAVIVVDMAIHTKTKEKIFLLAQSYMPAQELQILYNPNDSRLNPWYSLNFGDELVTPEWTFSKYQLKRFR